VYETLIASVSASKVGAEITVTPSSATMEIAVPRPMG
jgi:hypothetical protein